jgi:peroxiredoxin
MVRYIFAIAVLLASFSCSSKKEDKPVVARATVNEYPALTLTLASGEKLPAKELQGKNIFVLFQPECDHCQQEAAEIEKNLDRFRAYTLYFISSSPMPQVTKFAADYRLNNKPNVKFAVTSTESVLNFYGPIPTPSVYIYQEGRLINYFNGQTKIENILAAL